MFPWHKIIKPSQVLCLIHVCSHEFKVKQSKIEIAKINEVGFNPTINDNKLRIFFIDGAMEAIENLIPFDHV